LVLLEAENQMAQDKLKKDPRTLVRPRKSSKGRGTELDFLVGRRLREARLLTGITQGQLGQALGVSFQAVQKYESGENRLAVGRLARAAKVLERPVSYFFTEEEPAAGSVVGLTPQEAELIRSFRGIARPDLRESLLKLARQINELHAQLRE
jgi:transcriptional regulator with XRE-family HTH domain